MIRLLLEHPIALTLIAGGIFVSGVAACAVVLYVGVVRAIGGMFGW